MRAGATKAVALMALLAVAGCSGSEVPRLLNLGQDGEGPDEFAILPTKPLQAPENFSALPTPTPGGVNRVDATPNADAIAALGGNPNAAGRGVPSSDAGLVAYASRQGRSGTIRQELAAEDVAFRKNNRTRVLERLFNVNVYFKAYRPQSLDKYAELERFRQLGVRTPTAPPEPAE